jgi:AraC family transcriptional regulator, regulatory protein of adaptative response / methylated-DNA-[protein]-cysteine methyltransferase
MSPAAHALPVQPQDAEWPRVEPLLTLISNHFIEDFFMNTSLLKPRAAGMLVPFIRATATIGFAIAPCSLGFVIVAVSEQLIRAILVGDDPEMLVSDLQNQFPNDSIEVATLDDEKLVARVVEMIDRPEETADLPLDVRGSDFQRQVWDALQRVPAGTTVSYTFLAEQIGAPGAVRAVAQACAANPLAVAIPCHRAVRADGGLAGYRWGIDRKRALLERECRDKR